jgi:hypothetical protein
MNYVMTWCILLLQMGAEAVESAILTFLNLFGKDQMAHAIINEGSAGTRAIEKFLGILEFVVKEPGSSFRKFVPSTLSLCLEHIYPLVADVRMIPWSYSTVIDILKLKWILK